MFTVLILEAHAQLMCDVTSHSEAKLLLAMTAFFAKCYKDKLLLFFCYKMFCRSSFASYSSEAESDLVPLQNCIYPLLAVSS